MTHTRLHAALTNMVNTESRALKYHPYPNEV